MRALKISMIVVALAAIGGCGDDDRPGRPDAGGAVDGGSTADGGPGSDAGGAADGGSMDGGGTTDAGATDGGAPPTDGGRDTRCDDGTDPLCPMPEPTCGAGEVAAVQGSCWQCVNARTCRPWGEAGCADDMGCSPTERCDTCATSSCAACDDCVAACVEHGCPTETTLTCRCARPTCDPGFVAVIQEGCWVCVDLATCGISRGGC